MHRLIQRVIQNIKTLASEEKVRFTNKAYRELYNLELELDENDVYALLQDLRPHEFKHRERSKITEEWLYVFKIEIFGVIIYLKLILRKKCIIISFHED